MRDETIQLLRTVWLGRHQIIVRVLLNSLKVSLLDFITFLLPRCYNFWMGCNFMWIWFCTILAYLIFENLYVLIISFQSFWTDNNSTAISYDLWSILFEVIHYWIICNLILLGAVTHVKVRVDLIVHSIRVCRFVTSDPTSLLHWISSRTKPLRLKSSALYLNPVPWQTIKLLLTQSKTFIFLLISIGLHQILTLFFWQGVHLAALRLFLFELEHFFKPSLTNLCWRDFVFANNFILHLLDLFVWHCWDSKSYVWLLFATFRWSLLLGCKQTSFFINVPEICQAVKGHNLIHVVNTLDKVKITLDRCHLVISLFCLTRYIVFIILWSLCTKLTFNDKRKWVWNLVFASKYFPYQARTVHIDRVYWPEVRLIKAAFNEVLNIELKVQPYTLQNHTWRNSSMHGLSCYIVFRVCIGLRAIEDQPLLRVLRICEANFKMKLLFIKYFDL